MSGLMFEVTEDIEGGYAAECLTESIVTQGDTWEELRTNIKDAVEASTSMGKALSDPDAPCQGRSLDGAMKTRGNL